MYVIYEDQKYGTVRVGQSTDDNYKRAIIKATSRYRYNHHSFMLRFNGNDRTKFIDNQSSPEF